MIYSDFNSIGKNNIKSTRSDLTSTIGEDGMKDIIRKVLIGGNVRDTTEFITQRRLLSSYAAMFDLFTKSLKDKTDDPNAFSAMICDDLLHAHSDEQRILDLWLLGLTKKGLDNIVRTKSNLLEYKDSFADSFDETVSDIEDIFGPISGSVTIGEKTAGLSWNLLLLLFLAIGSQTLSIRGSAKSMNGKLFEKLLLGTLISIIGFEFCPYPPSKIEKDEKLFWLSNMDENERETDATLVYNNIAISIDIGFIGKGNPEISLDKVTRFNRYKQIAGLDHTMKTIIIVDTVSDGSDLFNKAERVDGIVLQMSHNDWVISFAKAVCEIFSFDHTLSHLSAADLDLYFKEQIKSIDIERFIQ